MERRHAVWPNDTVVIVVLFDGGGDHAANTDAIAAHDQGFGFAVFIQYGGFRWLRVFGAKLENMADFDTAFDIECAFAIWAWIAHDDIAQVADFA